LQLAVGNAKRADRAIVTALSLSPNSRVTLRTVARYYVHVGEPDRAHALIARHERTAGDPWLMASEIALAQASGEQRRFAVKGRRFSKSNAAPVRHLSELRGALGGLELASGAVRHARE